jgi:hypothetical protein
MPDLCIIPAAALEDEELTGTDIRILCAIGKHTDRNGVGCFAKAETLADEARVSRNQFFISTRKLLERGWIERDSGQEEGRPSKYAIVFPSLRKQGGVSKNGTPQEYLNSGRGSSEKRDGTTISAPINEASPLGKRFSRNELSDVNLFLARISGVLHPEGLLAWEAEIRAMLDGMPGHVLATPADIAKACRDATANGKSADPNMRQFRRYVAGAVESAKSSSDSAALKHARELWSVIVKYGVLQSQTIEQLREDFTNAFAGGDLVSMKPEEAFDIFLSLNRGMLKASTSKEFPIRHIADRIANRARGSHNSKTDGENGATGKRDG